MPRSQALSLRVPRPRKAPAGAGWGDRPGEPKADFSTHAGHRSRDTREVAVLRMRKPGSDDLPGHSAQENDRKARLLRHHRVGVVNGVHFGRYAGRVQRF